MPYPAGTCDKFLGKAAHDGKSPWKATWPKFLTERRQYHWELLQLLLALQQPAVAVEQHTLASDAEASPAMLQNSL